MFQQVLLWTSPSVIHGLNAPLLLEASGAVLENIFQFYFFPEDFLLMFSETSAWCEVKHNKQGYLEDLLQNHFGTKLDASYDLEEESTFIQ